MTSSTTRRLVQATFFLLLTASLTRCDCGTPNTSVDGGVLDGGDGGGTATGGGTGTGGGGGTDCADQDGDGYGVGSGCQGDDCNDADPAVHPGATEACNGLDDNCNALLDEGLADLTCGVGACARTVTACVGGVVQVCTPGQSAGEQCNGLDDDCNGVVDDGPAGQSQACLTGQDGVCAPGLTQCLGDAGVVCMAEMVAGPEACNGLDDNCNGGIDENDPDGGVSCNSGELGACSAGTTLCADGGITCVPLAQPSVEWCNGIDDNCDGLIDDGNPDAGVACSTGLDGVCGLGATTCEDGGLLCVQQFAPIAELCNGLDDDCNGTADENDPGGNLSCDTGLLGVCQPGATTCADGGVICVGTASPSAETCNGLDDNCDGVADDGSPGAGVSCTTGLLGQCSAGSTICVDGGVACTQNNQPILERCNGLDDDCDGVDDQGDPDGGVACSTGLLGLCAAGTTSCASGAIACNQNVPPAAEVCDGLDNDCDGANDNGNPGSGAACVTGQLGVCAPGTTNCTSGAISCDRDLDPSGEVCDGEDNDCDGVVDQGNPGGAASCNTGNLGVCAAGTTACTGGAVQCNQNLTPSAEVCDGQDNNCDGATDEGNPGGGVACNTGLQGVCSTGTTSCTGGVIVCNQNVQPSAEICDGLDNDCAGGVDDGNPGSGASCSTGNLGVCAAGSTTCTAGAIACTQLEQPGAETCDGLDNNCNGTVDDGNPGGGVACTTGLLGACEAGTSACTGGAIVCNQDVQPSAEVCNAVDDDCDGVVNNGDPGGGVSCSTGEQGVCSAGTTACTANAIVCDRNQDPGAELCDGLDNDCDGTVDNGNPGGGVACTTGLAGVCSPGTTVCTAGALSCAQNVQPSAEVCDGLDNNCNGAVDEGNPGGGLACNTGNLGVCAAGTTACGGGAIVCTQNVQPSPEVCDSLDNDCDGTVNDGNPGGGAACATGQTGVCAAGTTACTAEVIVCNANLTPSPEVCDGLDNDCNGVTDNGNPGGGGACNTGQPGVCAAGTIVCSNGALACNGNVNPSSEICDGLDNDCDGSVDTNAAIADGIPNTCGAATGLTVNVPPSAVQDVTGYVDVNGDDYFVVNFSGAGGPGSYYHPRIDLLDDAAGQFILSVENSCGSGAWCGADMKTVEMAFPLNPNNCLSFGNCSDTTPRYTQWVVRVKRTSGAPNCSSYTVRLSNQ